MLSILQEAGFDIEGQSGSHVKLRRFRANGSKETLVVPYHRSLKVGMLRGLVHQASAYLDDEQLRAFFED